MQYLAFVKVIFFIFISSPSNSLRFIYYFSTELVSTLWTVMTVTFWFWWSQKCIKNLNRLAAILLLTLLTLFISISIVTFTVSIDLKLDKKDIHIITPWSYEAHILSKENFMMTASLILEYLSIIVLSVNTELAKESLFFIFLN